MQLKITFPSGCVLTVHRKMVWIIAFQTREKLPCTSKFIRQWNFNKTHGQPNEMNISLELEQTSYLQHWNVPIFVVNQIKLVWMLCASNLRCDPVQTVIILFHEAIEAVIRFSIFNYHFIISFANGQSNFISVIMRFRNFKV